MPEEIKFKLRDYDGGLDGHPTPESAGQLWLVGSWWELHFKHIESFVNGELTDYVLEALSIDAGSCLVSIRDSENDGEILCSFVLPHTSAERFSDDLDRRLREIERGEIDDGTDSGDRSDDRDHADESTPEDFRVGMKMLVGHELSLRSIASNPAYELRSSEDQRLASVRTYPKSGDLAHLVCADGAWRVNKRRKRGWELVIESYDGTPVGSYSGNHWRLGGAILLSSGSEVLLRHSPRGRWELGVANTGEPIVDIHGHSPSWCLTVRSLPTDVYSDIEPVILTACAVLVLEASFKPVFTPG